MKSLAELAAIKDKMKANETIRHDGERAKKIVIGMDTCGIEAGARDITKAVTDELATKNIEHVTVALAGCKGKCDLEPTMDVVVPGHDRVTYVNVTPDKVSEIISSHIEKGVPIMKYAVGANEKG